MSKTKRLTLTAMFLALGFILPLFTGQIPQIGSMLLPMHIPVFLCALICGYQYGVPMAFILPLIRSVLFARPNMYPEAISIAFEMAVYAFVSDFLYKHLKQKNLISLYASILIAMVAGRAVRAVIQLSLLRIKDIPYSFGMFFSGVVVTGIPGIVLQLIIVPIIINLIEKKGEKYGISR